MDNFDIAKEIEVLKETTQKNETSFILLNIFNTKKRINFWTLAITIDIYLAKIYNTFY